MRVCFQSAFHVVAGTTDQLRSSGLSLDRDFCNLRDRPPQGLSALNGCASAWQLPKLRYWNQNMTFCLSILLMQAVLTKPSSGTGCENKHHFNKADRRAKDRHQRSEKENKCFHWRELPCKLVSTSSYCSVMIVCILLVCPLLHLTAVMMSFTIEDLNPAMHL